MTREDVIRILKDDLPCFDMCPQRRWGITCRDCEFMEAINSAVALLEEKRKGKEEIMFVCKDCLTKLKDNQRLTITHDDRSNEAELLSGVVCDRCRVKNAVIAVRLTENPRVW